MAAGAAASSPDGLNGATYGKLKAPIRPPSDDFDPSYSRKWRRRCVLTSLCGLLTAAVIVALVTALVLRSRHHHGGGSDKEPSSVSTGAAAIQAACNQTLYPDFCVEWLSSDPDSLSADPAHLAGIAVRLALSVVRESAASFSANLSSITNNFTAQSVRDCIELMDLSTDQLNISISDLASLSLFSLKSELSEIMSLLSGTMGFELACSQGLLDQLSNSTTTTNNNNNNTALLAMIASQEKLSKALIVAIGIVDALTDLGTDLSSWKSNLHFRRRRLLGFDATTAASVDRSWADEAQRRMLASSTVSADVVVAKDGSGNYKTIADALKNVPSNRTQRYTIYIKKGTYSEYLNIPKSLSSLTLIGDGIGQTIITGSKSNTGGYTTYESSTVAVMAADFVARKITFQNTAGAAGHQAVALRVGGDRSVFDGCSFEGYQDTLYALSNRQFYTGCTIKGTIDFIFGNAIAVFQRCSLLARQPMSNQKNTFTAQGRKVSSDPSGYSFHLCTVAADSDLQSSSYKISSYLARPWQAYSRAVWMESSISSVIDPAGYLPWDATNPYTTTLYYGEYKNTGAGAGTSGRVNWKGVHPAMSAGEASGFTVQNFISGSSWLPATGVTYQLSLSSS